MTTFIRIPTLPAGWGSPDFGSTLGDILNKVLYEMSVKQYYRELEMAGIPKPFLTMDEVYYLKRRYPSALSNMDWWWLHRHARTNLEYVDQYEQVLNYNRAIHERLLHNIYRIQDQRVR